MNIFEKIHALLVSNEVNVWHFPKRCDGKPFVYWLLSENNPNGHDFDDLVEMVEEAYSHIDPPRKPLPERVVEPTCGFVPPTPGYAACTREKGHDGPCAHPFAHHPVEIDTMNFTGESA